MRSVRQRTETEAADLVVAAVGGQSLAAGRLRLHPNLSLQPVAFSARNGQGSSETFVV